ncbi:hypothetical protein CABS01_07886 [Colletotrichum abscissum]|nr:uncharacterized protein CABS01_07886 [Colletotrichum abscissum]KAK1510214.1 hypothetical protein CABS01_07886 [Colletotrichum abscissum]
MVLFPKPGCFSSASWKSRGSALSRVPEPRVSSLDFRVGREYFRRRS